MRTFATLSPDAQLLESWSQVSDADLIGLLRRDRLQHTRMNEAGQEVDVFAIRERVCVLRGLSSAGQTVQ